MNKLKVLNLYAGIFMVILILLSIIAISVFADEIDDIIPFVIQVESSGNPNAVSKAGAVGLMQITPIVLEEWNRDATPIWLYNQTYEHKKHLYRCEYTKSDLWNTKANIQIGEWYLRRLKDHYLGAKGIVAHKPVVGISADLVIFNGQPLNYIYMHPDDARKYNIKNDKDMELALILAAYNGGITRLRRCGYDINKMPRETRNYVRKVMKLYKEA